MRLSNLAISKGRPKEKPYKLSDGDGLVLLAAPNGRKLWRFHYQLAGRENMLALGPYPIISLADARRRRDDARRLLVDGIDPAAKRKQQKAALAATNANTFGAIVAELLARKKDEEAAESTLS